MAAWSYEQSFDGLNTADLNGQDSWSGDAAFDVQETTFYDGTKAVSATTTAQVTIDRSVTAGPDSGTMYIAARTSIVAGASDESWMLQLRGGGAFRARIRFTNGNIVYDIGAGSGTLVTGYSANTWYIFGFRFDSATNLSINVNGGSFTSSTAMGGTVDLIRFGSPDGTSATAYWDRISLTYPSNDLSISVSDAVTVSENIGADLMLNVSVSDTVTVSETVTLDNMLNVSVFDAIAVSEVVVLDFTLDISVSDAVTVSENLKLELLIDISVFDTATIAESLGTDLMLDISVSDAVTVSEAVALDYVLDISVSDAIAVSESVGLDLPLDISVSDAVTVSENIGADLGLDISVLDISVFDLASISESIGIDIPFDISVSDAITVSENVNLEFFFDISVFDSVTVAESVTFVVRSNIGLVHLRSQQQSYPVPMDENSYIKLDSKEQSYPKALDDEEIL